MANESLVTVQSLGTITAQMMVVVAATTAITAFSRAPRLLTALIASLIVSVAARFMTDDWHWEKVGATGLLIAVFNAFILFCASTGSNQLLVEADNHRRENGTVQPNSAGGRPTKFRGKQDGQSEWKDRSIFRSWFED